jgi:hypothetical protein
MQRFQWMALMVSFSSDFLKISNFSKQIFKQMEGNNMATVSNVSVP